jgi:tetratricopeptide (TPR) repeat protein
MELVSGGTLRGWLRAGPRGWREVVTTFREAGKGLAAAHAAGLVHRDFKPENVLVGDDGRVRVGDFGLVSAYGFGASPAGGLGLTATGARVGTPYYMAPEQLLGKPVDARADVFAFSLTLYEALWGERPFRGRDFESLVADVTGDRAIVPPSGREVPGWLREIVLRGLARDPAARWASMDALLAALSRDRDRRGWVLAGAALLALAGGGAWALSLAATPSAGPTCEGGRAELAGAWDPEVSAAVRARFAATGVEFADDSWRRVSGALDRYADGWASVHKRVCEATQRGEQSAQALDLEMACLARRRSALRALTSVLAQADAVGVSRASSAVESLPASAECGDLALLGPSQPLPAEPIARNLVEVARNQLAAAGAMGDTGELQAGSALAELAWPLARASGHLPVQAEALRLGGSLLRRLGQIARSEKALFEATVIAEETMSDDLVIEAQSELAWVIGSERLRIDEGLRQAALAGATLKRRPDSARESFLENVLGHIQFDADKLAEARAHYQRSMAIELALPSPAPGRIAARLVSLGNVEQRAERYDVAIELYERALGMYEQAFGPNHREVGLVLGNLGWVTMHRHGPEGAIEYYRRALALRERVFGEHGRDVAMTLLALSRPLDQTGQLEEAEAAVRRAVTIFETLTDDAMLPQALDYLGLILRRREKYPAALDAFRRAIDVRKRLIGADNPELGYSWRSIAETLDAMNDLAGAEEAYVQSTRAFAGQGPDSVEGALSGCQLAALLSRRGRHAEALGRFATICTTLERVQGPTSWRLEICLAEWGHALGRAGRVAEGLKLLERAVAMAEADEDPEYAAELRQIIASLKKGKP